MPDYDLSRMSSRSFEHLVQSLADRLLGPGIVVFGDGPDGGREATFERQVPYPTPVGAWNGYGVIQAKYRQRSGNTQQDGNWAVEQLKDEIQKYTNPDSNLRKPDYFIYATNVVLTPVLETGSKDRTIAVLEKFKKQSTLKDYAIWDYDQIRTFLDAYEDVRNAYAHFVTPGDVLARVISQLSPSPANMYDTLAIFLEKELLSDEYVNLEQAGHNVDERIPLATVLVDLPTRDDTAGLRQQFLEDADIDFSDTEPSTYHGGGFIRDILAASSELLDPASLGTSVISNSLDSGVLRESLGRFVLIGGPGQGKTTLTQFICQIFRASIISGKPSHTLSMATQNALTTIQNHCKIEGINHEVVPRFPFKLILNDFARELSSSSASQTNSVLGYLSRQIGNRTTSNVSADDLRRFLAVYPSVIIFDGLDEVPASSNRDQVLDAIRDFWIDASNANADILSIATTRPQGYNEDFSPQYYEHRQLAELSEQLGWHFAQRLAEVRYRTDEDRKQRVLGRLKRAFSEDSTARLMRSPLQITIMTALVDRIGQPPEARWELFNSYYDVIYHREVERSIPASTILRDYRPDIRAIHNQVGLILQIDSERTGSTDAKLSRDRFVSLVESRLKAEGHTGQGLHILAKQIVEAASQRLVFLVEVESEQIGFEIRSLQEFMAAESLMDGADQHIRERMGEIAPIPFWRNVFLFAAGKCFAERQELRDTVHAICASLNELDGDELAGIYLAGSELAIELLDEGSARRQPRFENLLARIAVRAIDTANPDLHMQLADVYESQLESIFQEELRLRLASGSKISSVGAWNCLLRLVASDIPWAVQLATEKWPSDQQNQIRILRTVADPTRNRWLTDKLLLLLPSTSVTTLERLTHWDVRRNWLDGKTLEPEQEAAISVLESSLRHSGPELKVLNTHLFYVSLVRLNGSEYAFLKRLRHIENWHSSWHVFKHAGEFLEAPSKDSLANALKSIADYLYAESDSEQSFKGWNLPWPILACVNACSNSSDLLKLADRAAQGELGDVDDWIAAETRWVDNGITGEDLVSMSDDRLPFDARIGETGFPTTLDLLTSFMFSPRPERVLEDVLDVFDILPLGKTRSFVAQIVNMLVFGYTFPTHLGESSTLPDIDLQTLKSVYREIPTGSPVPLHILVNLVGDSNSEVVQFFSGIEHKEFQFVTRSSSSQLVERSVDALRRAYMSMNESSAVLLPILGIVAENGQLSGKHVDIIDLSTHEMPLEKLDGLIVNLSQQTWHTDNSEQLIASAQEIGDLSGNDFSRIVSTLEAIRLAGETVGLFAAALKRLLPLDNYLAHQCYVGLLENLLRRRTSQFPDSNKTSLFALPEGVTGLLRE